MHPSFLHMTPEISLNMTSSWANDPSTSSLESAAVHYHPAHATTLKELHFVYTNCKKAAPSPARVQEREIESLVYKVQK
jgi:hypothetical protein